jgi:hypothetical protein
LAGQWCIGVITVIKRIGSFWLPSNIFPSASMSAIVVHFQVEPVRLCCEGGSGSRWNDKLLETAANYEIVPTADVRHDWSKTQIDARILTVPAMANSDCRTLISRSDKPMQCSIQYFMISAVTEDGERTVMDSWI